MFLEHALFLLLSPVLATQVSDWALYSQLKISLDVQGSLTPSSVVISPSIGVNSTHQATDTAAATMTKNQIHRLGFHSSVMPC